LQSNNPSEFRFAKPTSLYTREAFCVNLRSVYRLKNKWHATCSFLCVKIMIDKFVKCVIVLST